VHIAAWLRELGLERYAQAFQESEIDAQILPKLTADDLKDIGVTAVGHRRKLLEEIAALGGPASAPQMDPSAAAETTPMATPPPEATLAPAPAREAERRQLTVLFCDLVGSTELSARLDPEDMGKVIRAYQDAAAGEIARFDGFVAQFLGDGVLAYFGWPNAHEDEAERAVRAGLAAVAHVAGLTTVSGERLAARVGIATGTVVVGELIGQQDSQQRAVVGETPNLAARLQALAQPGQVVVSWATRGLVGDLFELVDLGEIHLKGLTLPVHAFAVSGERPVESRFEALQGALLAQEHCEEDGIELTERAAADLDRLGLGWFRPFVPCALVTTHLDNDNPERAAPLIAQTFARIDKTGERWIEPEMHRLNGEATLLGSGDAIAAESDFKRALDLAQSQSAKSWELRGAVSLARLWAEQGGRHKAHDLLARVYDWSTEGFETADLKDAKALLDELR
jgi:class 3 adenylate cyclase